MWYWQHKTNLSTSQFLKSDVWSYLQTTNVLSIGIVNKKKACCYLNISMFIHISHRIAV